MDERAPGPEDEGLDPSAIFDVFRRFGIEKAEIMHWAPDEVVFVVPPAESGQLRERPITEELMKLLQRKVWVGTGGSK